MSARLIPIICLAAAAWIVVWLVASAIRGIVGDGTP